MVVCNKCKRDLPAPQFGTRRYKGQVVTKKYCNHCSAIGRAAADKYRLSEHGSEKIKEISKTAYKTASAKESIKYYRKTEKFAAYIEKYKNSEVYKKHKRKTYTALMENPSKKLRVILQNRIGRRLKTNKVRKSDKLLTYTCFKSVAEIRQHFESVLPHGVSIKDHGKTWEIEHTIPCMWYDHSDPDDVRRCWSRANMGAMSRKENMDKYIQIPDDQTLMRIGSQHWPKAWNGSLLSQETKDQMYSDFYHKRSGTGFKAA